MVFQVGVPASRLLTDVLRRRLITSDLYGGCRRRRLSQSTTAIESQGPRDKKPDISPTTAHARRQATASGNNARTS
jgi:hypothetical protein